MGVNASALALNSLKYRRRNSSHFSGSWPNQRRKALLGATSLSQDCTCKAVFFTPRGQSRSTRKRVPSAEAAGSYTRFSLMPGFFINLLSVSVCRVESEIAVVDADERVTINAAGVNDDSLVSLPSGG